MGPHARIWLFGSRVDDSRRGGDVDLYVEPESVPSLESSLLCKSALADAPSIGLDDGEVLAGQIPRKQLRLVQASIELHRDELMADWDLATSGELPYKIEPL